ncbi:SigE family RNA polymerase sigma factor [Pseudofrankia sp. BMG5.37]|uniref:SigE family RNA polymerase sigma factor n=1 Tax=Pseudofrankia sp. BMG5.37 TaxID=3050035 RepID=UPI0028944A40|nr:SigE family RNA polymerase sigma factor [Pseudofrankia sp. BMG5.37]MDT3442749.1 SigE family RNA polymerase sigma factor [Pseudofrankia sp. BMG5.37]
MRGDVGGEPRARGRGVKEGVRARPAGTPLAKAPPRGNQPAENRTARNPADGDPVDGHPVDGDPADEDFAGFVRRCGTRLTRFAYLLVGDVGQAEDLVQTALVKTWLRGTHVTADGREAYVRRVMVTTSVSWWRGARWRRERLPGPAAAGGGGDRPDLTERADPVDAILLVDERDVLVAALRQLPPRQRAAVLLRHYLALTEAETAAVLRCSVGTVKSQTSRGLATLRTMLEAGR